MINSKYNLDLSLKSLGLKKFYDEGFLLEFSYNYIIKIPSSIEGEIKFSDGEVESVEWMSKDEILNKINEKEKITPDSVDVFKYYMDMDKLC